MKGIDVVIESLRTLFENNLWISNNTIYYGRIFRNIREDGTHPEFFNTTTKDYEDVLLDDNKDAICFFDVQPSEDYTAQFESTVWICFAVNLKALYPAVAERATEYAHEDVLNYIKKARGGWDITGLVRGLPAFDEYELLKNTDSMNPFYLFRFETNINYPINC
jgi:hypothetical protein